MRAFDNAETDGQTHYPEVTVLRPLLVGAVVADEIIQCTEMLVIGCERQAFEQFADRYIRRVGQLSVPWIEAEVACTAVVLIARETQLAGDCEDVTRTVTRLHRNQPAALRARFGI